MLDVLMITGNKQISIFCGFILFLILLYITLLFYKQNYKINSKKVFLLICISVIVYGTLTELSNVFEIFSVKAENQNTEQLKPLNNNFSKEEIKKYPVNKIIVIGDSRMEFLSENPDVEVAPNVSFIALSGSEIGWLKEKAVDKLKEVLDKKDKDIPYHVVFNMGVNDINYTSKSSQKIAQEYYDIYKDLVQKYKDVSFYMLSINPIGEDKIQKKFKGKLNSNSLIEVTNREMQKFMREDSFDNLYYCDSYHHLKFNLPDGLHYDTPTDQRIIDYISNKCILYK